MSVFRHVDGHNFMWALSELMCVPLASQQFIQPTLFSVIRPRRPFAFWIGGMPRRRHRSHYAQLMVNAG